MSINNSKFIVVSDPTVYSPDVVKCSLLVTVNRIINNNLKECLIFFCLILYGGVMLNIAPNPSESDDTKTNISSPEDEVKTYTTDDFVNDLNVEPVAHDPKEIKLDDTLNNIGLLKAKFSDAIQNGTAVVLPYSTQLSNNNIHIQYALTAAHVIKKGKEISDLIFFEQRCNNEDKGSSLINSFTIRDVHIHPKYSQYPSPDSGYDIAIIEIKDPKQKIMSIKRISITTISSTKH